MTLAHELQHFIQHCTEPVLRAENMLIQDLSEATIKALSLDWPDIPIEREARIVAKRTVEDIFGEIAVAEFIAEKIAHPVNEADRRNWIFIQGTPTSASFDIAQATKQLFTRLKPYTSELESILQNARMEQGKYCPELYQIELNSLLADDDLDFI